MSVTNKALFVIERNLHRDLTLDQMQNIAMSRAFIWRMPLANLPAFPSWNIGCHTCYSRTSAAGLDMRLVEQSCQRSGIVVRPA